MIGKFLVYITGFFLISTIVQAQVLSPRDFFPHDYGEEFTPHHLLVDYYYHVAEHSSRVQVFEYGRTYQNRPLIYAVLTHEDNIDQINEIRENNLIRANRMKGLLNPKFDKSIVWLSFGVHGNEAGASESSLKALYALATGNHEADIDWLKNTVVILDPCLNPDGFNRYTNWQINASGNYVNLSSVDREHHEPWPTGRVNHYLHDLNRDWAWVTQIESQQRVKIYQEWLPHIHADFHEMGAESPYFFAPAAEPFHAYITQWQRSFQSEIGKNHAKYFDKKHWLYYTREDFDLFYPSYGDTYATFNGAIGMTYEQGGSGRAGRAILLKNGDTLTLQDRIDHHVATAISTVEVASKNSPEILVEFKKFFDGAMTDTPGKFRNYVIGRTESEHIDAFIKLLDVHQIEYGHLVEDQSFQGYRFSSFTYGKFEGRKGDIVVPVNQPAATLIQVLFEPESILSDSLTYDITSWSVMSAYGLHAVATEEEVIVDQAGDSNVASDEEIPDAYGYAISVSEQQFTVAVSKLIHNGITCRVAKRSFVNDDIEFPVGSVIITKADNKRVDVRELLHQVAQKTTVNVQPIYSGNSEKGPDFGSQYMVQIEEPKILLVSGENINANNYGQIWYYLDEVLQMPYTSIDVVDLLSVDQSQFNTIILPEGRYSDFDDEILSELKSWVRGGGKMIAFGRALNAISGESGFGFDLQSASQKQQEAEMLKSDRYEHIHHEQSSSWMPGAIVRINVDNSHPLGSGLSAYYSALNTSTTVMERSKDVWNVGNVGEELFSTGFIGHSLQSKLLNTNSFFVLDKGRGHVVGFVDNPLYRSFWLGGRRLFFNALYFTE